MRGLFENMIVELERSLDSIQKEVFETLISQSVETLKQGKKIVVSGLGKNVPVCEKFVGSMLSLGLDARYMNTNSAIHGDIGMVNTGDLVIILTKSGETAESIYLHELLAFVDCQLWLLTFEAHSTLTQRIPHSLVIDLAHEGDLWNIMPNYSTILNLMILQELVMQVAQSLELTLEDFKKNHPGGHIGRVLNG